MTDEWSYTYEARKSRLSTVRDPKSQVKTYDYFNDDNVQRVSYTDEEHATPDVSFTYDPDYNRVTTMLDGTGQTAYTYHPIGATPSLGGGRLATIDGQLDAEFDSNRPVEAGVGGLIDFAHTALAYRREDLVRA